MYTGGIPGESRRRVGTTRADHGRFGLDRRPGIWSAWKARADGQQEDALHRKHLLRTVGREEEIRAVPNPIASHYGDTAVRAVCKPGTIRRIHMYFRWITGIALQRSLSAGQRIFGAREHWIRHCGEVAYGNRDRAATLRRLICDLFRGQH